MKTRSVNEIIDGFRKRLASLSSPLANFAQYSNIYSLFRSVASVLTEQDTRLINAIDQSFISTANGSNLDRRATDYGFYRILGSKAKGSILIKSNKKGVIKKGSILTTSSNANQYEVESDIYLIPGEVSGRIVSVNQGSYLNLPSNTKLYSIVYKDVDITVGYSRDVINGKAIGDISGAKDQESDEEFRSRIKRHIGRRNTDVGSLTYLKEELLKVPYLSKVYILNHKPVPGYFSIYVDTRDSKHINSLYLLVSSLKPLGSLPLIKPLNQTPLSIRVECFDVSLGTADQVKNELKDAISLYISSFQIGQSLSLPELKSVCYQIYPKSKVLSPSTDIYIDAESLLSISSLQVLV